MSAMSEFSGLTLNEDALSRLSESKKPIFVLEWLRHLHSVLNQARNTDIKECQKQLVEQLMRQIQRNPGPPTRKLIGKCLSTLFSVGDAFLLFDTVNKCNEILKNKDDSPSFLPTKLAAIGCVGIMYENLGRLMGRSYEETVNILLKSLKNAESQLRCEIYSTLRMIVAGMGTAASGLHRDIFKAVRHGMTDRVLSVRCNAALCVQEMLKFAPFLYTTDLETIFSLCFRAFEGSNYEVRCCVSQLLGNLVAITQQASKSAVGKNRLATLDEVLGLLATGFLRGGIGFLKGSAGEMIKGSVVSRETRVGVTHAYVALASRLGSNWLERHLCIFISHLLDLVANPKAAASHMDAVYSRRCVSFVLRSVIGKQLGEKAQIQAVKDLINIINKYLSQGSAALEVGSDSATNTNHVKETIDPNLVQHILICALQEVGCIIESLGTTSSSLLNDQSIGVVDTIASLLVHPSPSARISATWTLRCVAVACPSQLTSLIERCLERLETMKTSPETIYGYSYALSALLGSACQTPLGIPHNKGKLIFSIAEDLLRSASQNSRLSLQRTQSGWQLIGAVMTLGPSVVRGLLPRMLLLWKNSFPRSSKELESEKARGDAFTWQITLENRAGALAAMSSFLSHCEKLVTDEVIRRLLTPVESAVTMLTSLSTVFKNHGPSVKASCAMVRLRLYETLLLLPPNSYDNSYTGLLRLLVAEFTLAENAANTTTSLLRNYCHIDDYIILGSWVQETDHKSIEDQLQPHSSSGSGAIEHDITCLYKQLKEDEYTPWPLPLGVTVIDKSCLVFAYIFRFVATKHRLQMLSHFQECIKHSKSARQEAIQINILTSILGALKSLAENKATIGSDDIKNTLTSLLFSMLSHTNPIIRCAAAQTAGRSAQVIADGKYVAELAQNCFDTLKSARDALSRTGHSLALGYLHRYVGSLGSTQHLNTSISILLALSQDSTSPLVQAWALHALTLIADSGGPMFRSYVEPTLSHSLKLLTTVSFYNCDVHQCIGRLLSAILTTVGPELQGNTDSVCATRSSLLLACAVMQEHSDALVQAEAISCLQQLHLFAPKHVDLAHVVPTLCKVLMSPHLYLRRASVSCLQQLAQCDAKEVCDQGYKCFESFKASDTKDLKNNFQSDYGIVGVLFTILDFENDQRLTSDIYKTITSLVQYMVSDNLHELLSLFKEVLTAADANSTTSSPDKDFDNDHAYDDDELTFKAEENTSHANLPPRWKTKVFATQNLCRVINACNNTTKSKYHFDLTLAREMKAALHGKDNLLVLHLSDLIRMSFMTATSDSDALRLEGLKALQLVIDKFSAVPEPEFPEHVILEQYQAQVGAALRPAFSPDTPSHVTAMACQVCSTWICSGVARDLNDLRRVHQLLVSSLAKLQRDSCSRLYNESASTLEKLAILKAWAEVYVVAMEQENAAKVDKKEDDEEEVYETSKESLLQLVKPELLSLSSNWLSALKDHALLTLPPEFSSQLPHDGGAFYTSDTIEMARPQYRNSWPPILHAAALWLCSQGFNKNENEDEDIIFFHLLFGICMEALCNPKSSDPVSYVIVCLKSLETLLSHTIPQSTIGKDKQLSIELCNVLHRLLLTRETLFCQNLVLNVSRLVVKAQQEFLELEKKKIQKELAPANQKLDESSAVLSSVGEGGETGDIVPGQSIVYALMEVCLCVLVRQLPSLSPTLASIPGLNIVPKHSGLKLIEESAFLIGKSLSILCELPELCSLSGSVVVLPSVLYLITGVLRETWVQKEETLHKKEPICSVLKCLERLISSPFALNSAISGKWIELLRSTLATILDMCKSSEKPRPDEITSVSVIGIFVLKSPSQVIRVPNLQYPCINLLLQSLQSQHEMIQLKCLQTLKSIFGHEDYSVKIPYIHSLAPRLIEIVGHLIKENCSLNGDPSKLTYDVIVNGLEAFEILINAAETDKRIKLLSLYLPLLVSVLSDDINAIRSKTHRVALHKYALQKLTAIGPIYQHEFRQIIGQVSHFRKKLETAIRSQQQIGSNGSSRQVVNHIDIKQESTAIKLKTDFSNYADNI